MVDRPACTTLLRPRAIIRFSAYGTDWLAFGHFVIALFFVGAWRDPVRHVWILHAGLIACRVIPLALICGAIRAFRFTGD